MLEDFQASSILWLPVLVLVIVPFLEGVWNCKVLSNQCFHDSFQKWEQAWKDWLHTVGPMYLSG